MDTVITSATQLPQVPVRWVALLAALASLVWAYDGLLAFIRGARKSLPTVKVPPPLEAASTAEWESLCARARKALDAVVDQLPTNLATEARQVPCLLRERAEKESEGYQTLGLYHNFIPGHKSDHNGPIVLYLKSIEDHCLNNGKDFDDEVRFVYLHELGHHFGWDEVDLVRHGLPSGRPPGQ